MSGAWLAALAKQQPGIWHSTWNISYYDVIFSAPEKQQHRVGSTTPLCHHPSSFVSKDTKEGHSPGFSILASLHLSEPLLL